MVEELQYDEEIECHHSYDQRCHTTYSTDFQPQQVEECDENYRKNCYIEYKNVAFDEPVEICNDKLVKNCDLEGIHLITFSLFLCLLTYGWLLLLSFVSMPIKYVASVAIYVIINNSLL